MERLFVNVYDKKGNIEKQCEATEVSIRFGAVRSLVELLKIGEKETTFDVLNTITTVWDELTDILSQMFPDMEKNDWDYVKLEELIPTVLAVLRMSVGKLNSIPRDSKNSTAE